MSAQHPITLNLSAEQQTLLDRYVAEGRFTSIDEAVGESLFLLEQQEFGPANLSPETIERLKESLKQLDRGETVSSEEMEAYFDDWEQKANGR